MKVLIIETCLFHLEIFPTWEKLLEGHELHFWSRKKLASKMKVEAIMGQKRQSSHIYTRRPPLSLRSHLKIIKGVEPDLIIFNTAEVDQRSMDCFKLFAEVKIPIVALCHQKKSFDAIADFGCPSISGCVLSPHLCNSHHFIHAVDYGIGANNLIESKHHKKKGLTLIVPGRVHYNARDYNYLGQLASVLEKGDEIVVLGDVANEARKPFDKLLAAHSTISHIGSSSKLPWFVKGIPFPNFLNTLSQADAILPLIEPDSLLFSHYMGSVISGSINLSIGLEKPLLGNEEYLKGISYLGKKEYQAYEKGEEKTAIDNLRFNLLDLKVGLKKKKKDLITLSKVNLNRIIEEVMNLNN